MSEPTGKQKDRAIAGRFGEVDRHEGDISLHRDDYHCDCVRSTLWTHIFDRWPRYADDVDAFVRLLGIVPGYSLTSEPSGGHRCKVRYQDGDGRAAVTRAVVRGCPMTALRDAVYAWIEASDE
jgi:hypothetical protein